MEATLYKLQDQDIFLTTDPLVPDFTNLKKSAKILIMGGGKVVTLPLPRDDQAFRHLIAGLQASLKSENSLVIGWDIKNLFSYVLARTGKNLNLGRRLIDLRVLESFAGEANVAPATFAQARQRLVNKGKLWKVFSPIYKDVYLPLIKEIIPHLETLPLSHGKKRDFVHSHYEINGTANGRMKTRKALFKSYLPHSLTPEEKRNLRSPGYEEFMYFDFCHYEVSILQWLSGDEVLGDFIEDEVDIYNKIWEHITGTKCNEIRRKRCKGIFLPVVFGLGKANLAAKENISEKTAQEFIDRIHRGFPVALNWVSRQMQLDEDRAIDYFGRIRFFAPNESYLARNFAIQSPAALICMYKLVELFRNLGDLGQLCFHLHDGYCIIADGMNMKKAYVKAKEILTSESFPGLKLRVACEAGSNLDSLETYS